MKNKPAITLNLCTTNKKVLPVILLFALALFTSFSLVAGKNDTLLTPKQMREDVQFFYKKLIETHPNPYQVYGPKELDKKIQQILKSLNKPLSVKEFWFKLAVVNSYFDGHTGINYLPNVEKYLMEAFNDRKYLLTIRDNHIFFNPQCLSIDSALRGKEITAINHISTQRLLQNAKLYISFEPMYQELFLPLLIIPMNANQIGNDTLLHIKYYDVDSRKHKAIDLTYNYYLNVNSQKKSDISSKYIYTKAEVYNLRHYPTEKIAIIELNTFNNTFPFPEYCAKIKEYMDSIIHSDVQHLFIDITANGGGNSKRGEEVLNYIQTEAESYKIDESGIKMSPLYIERRILKRKPHNSKEIDSIIKSYGGDTCKLGDVIYGDSYWTKKPVQETYKNKVYLLQSRNTYSAAVDMAVPFSYYKFGKVIGEETGGLMSCYTDIESIELPNSKIRAYYPIKHVVYVGSKEDGRGVLPDIEYKIENPRKSFTLEQLKEMLQLVEEKKAEDK